MLILISAFLIVCLFILSAFWAGSETALTSLSKYRIKKLIALNKSLSGPLGEWLESPYYLITTILVGNTVTNMALSFLCTLLLVNIFSHLNTEVIELFDWLGVTFLVLVFGEVTPKIFCRANPEKVTLISLPVLSRIEKITRPLVMPLLKLIALILPGIEKILPARVLTFLSIEEVKGLIIEGNHAGILGKDTSQMLQRVLHISDIDVSRIMTPLSEVEWANLDLPEEKFLDVVVEIGHSRVPVYHTNRDRVAGFVHTKDILWAWKKNNGKFTPDLVRPPYYISADKKIGDLLREFKSGETHLAFVADSVGNLLGIVTLEDILEEIVGEILDEYDVKEQ
jgi:putative hemolysin